MTLDELGLADNTIVIFTSDNGGETNVTSNAPLRAGKSSLYEGGIRVPLVVRWPKVVPARTVCREPISNVDFYPTLLECARVKPDRRQRLDGVSILPILRDPKTKLDRDALYWHYPLEKPHFLGGRSSGAIRQGDWKLIEFFDTGAIELYHLAHDPGEQQNLAGKYPGKTADLAKRLADWRRDKVVCKYADEKHDYPLSPMSFEQVTLQDGFWLPRLKVQAESTVPHALEQTGPAVENLRRCGNFLHGRGGELPFPHRFVSADLYKVMEGAAYLLMIKPDPALEKRLDEIIDVIAGAQQEDGYLYVSHICKIARPREMGETPYSWVVHSHELYNMGHMYEGAVAYYRATGKDKWLKVAEKSARHFNKVFFEGDPNYNGGRPVMQAPGHQELELALCKL